MVAMGLKGLLRAMVASPKIPYNDPNYDLKYDLAYITSRLIVSSGPVNESHKKWYRYPVEDLVKVLEFNHRENWHIWNLRGEGKGYEESDVYNKMSYYPFPDHQPPSFAIVLSSCKSIDRFLINNPDNVAVIHCKAGKGRSGTILCAYLMYEGYKLGSDVSVEEANRLYTQKRMRPGIGNGVSIRSQLRYLGYWNQYLRADDETKRQWETYNSGKGISVEIKSIRLKNGKLYLTHQKDPRLDIILQGYVPREEKGVKVGVQTISLAHFNSNFAYVDIVDNDIVVSPLSRFIVKEIVDFRIFINHLLFVWWNPLFEINQTLSNDPIASSFLVPFEDMDGFKGTSQRGPKLFDELQVNFSIRYNKNV